MKESACEVVAGALKLRCELIACSYGYEDRLGCELEHLHKK